jgi:hypothetical protein
LANICAVKPDALGFGFVGVGLGVEASPQLTVAEPNFDAPGAGSPPQLAFEKVNMQEFFPEQSDDTY